MAKQEETEALGKALDRSLLKRLVVYIRPYRWHVIAAVAMAIISSGFFALRPYVSKIAIDDYLLLKITAACCG